MEYEKRIVCYMDILGFKQKIYDSEDNAEVRNKIFETLHVVETIRNNFRSNLEWGIESEFSFFSDSIVITYKAETDRSDLMDLIVILNDISIFAFQLLLKGMFVRGGLSYGKVFHKEDICFGPAMVNSVLLEQDVAVFPRIAIDPDFFNEDMQNSIYYGRTEISAMNRSYLEDRFHCVDFRGDKSMITGNIWDLRKNREHVHFLDCLDCRINEDESVAQSVKTVIEKELKTDYCQHIKEKYAWFKDYYNSVVYNTQCMEKMRII